MGEPQRGSRDPRGHSCEPGPALLRSCGQLDGGAFVGESGRLPGPLGLGKDRVPCRRCLSHSATWPMLLDAGAGWGPRTAYHVPRPSHGPHRGPARLGGKHPCCRPRTASTQGDRRYVPPSAVRVRVGRAFQGCERWGRARGRQVYQQRWWPSARLSVVTPRPGSCPPSARLLPRRASWLTLSWSLCSRSLACKNCGRQVACVCERAARERRKEFRSVLRCGRGFTFSRGPCVTPSRRTPSCNCPFSGCFLSSWVTDPSSERAHQTGRFPSKLVTREFMIPDVLLTS